MAKVLVAYGTTEGQTSKIAQHVGHLARELGHAADVVHLAEPPEGLSLDHYDAAVVASSVHEGRHQRYVRTWAKEHHDWLASHPSAFLSVSLSAAGDDEESREAIKAYIEDFAKETGWTPDPAVSVEGALRYTQYNWLKRFLLREISRSHGGDTDTSHDHEYTRWSVLDERLTPFFRELPSE
ncbi:MAG: flavodoxin domain-containing protein [Polyangiales bacterium]